MRAFSYKYKTMRVQLVNQVNEEVLYEGKHRISIRVYGGPYGSITPVKSIIFPEFTRPYEPQMLEIRVYDGDKLYYAQDVNRSILKGNTLRWRGAHAL